jgi:hypothetical protein
LREVRVSLVGVDEPRNWPRYTTSGLDVLAALPSDPARFQFLLDRLLTQVNEPSTLTHVTDTHLESAWTPLVARVLFVEMIRDYYLQHFGDPAFKAPFARFLNQLNLKLNNSQPSSQMDSAEPLDFTIHDGYYLGGFLMPSSTADHSNGIDCSVLIQFGLESAGMPRVGERYTTDSMRHYSSAYQQVFARQALNCEAQLELGDVIVQSHHAVVFRGYLRDGNGQLAMVTSEATGFQIGGVGWIDRDLYLGQNACHPPKIAGHARDPIFLYRPKWSH